MPLIFTVDDETEIRRIVADILKKEGHTIKEFATAKSMLKEFSKKPPDLILLDLWLESESSGMETLAKLMKADNKLPVIVISGHGTVDNAVHAVKLGAYDFIEKPFSSETLLIAVRRALENVRLKKELASFETHRNFDLLFCGNSKAVGKLRSLVNKIAPSNARVLIVGNSGTGKLAVAEKLHRLSKAGGNLIQVDSSPLKPQQLKEIVANNQNSTIYLDEIQEIPKECALLLLKILQQSDEALPRFVASSDGDLKKLIAEGKFLAELYYRLAVFTVELPCLSERASDIPLLIKNFGRDSYQFSKAAMAALQTYRWDGNLWELRNIVDRIDALAKSSRTKNITLSMLPEEIRKPTGDSNLAQDITAMPLKQARREFERNYLALQLKRCGGNVRKVSELSGIERTALYVKLKGLGLDKKNIADK